MTANMNELIGKVRQWGEDKGITGPSGKATVHTQFSKLIDEVGELGDELGVRDDIDITAAMLELGDCAVVLILLADLMGATFEDCLEGAYLKIAKRTGSMVNGQFVKDAEVAK